MPRHYEDLEAQQVMQATELSKVAERIELGRRVPVDFRRARGSDSR